MALKLRAVSSVACEPEGERNEILLTFSKCAITAKSKKKVKT